MTWHLKDRELEKKIIAIDPEFLKRLQTNQKILFSPLPPIVPSLLPTHEILKGALKYEFELRTKKGILGKLVFNEFELEDIPEYNPHAWNEYPKVTPPQNKPLRVEFADKGGTKAFFDDCLREYITGKEINAPCRFRPWED